MREIKFRRVHFFDEECKEFSHYSEWGVRIKGSTFTSPSSNNFAPYYKDCQFTGLKDKNGVEIYEGDLLSDPYPIDEEDLSKGYHESSLPVVWCQKALQWCVDASFSKDGSFLTSLVEYFGDNLEVIGNIYESATELKCK